MKFKARRYTGENISQIGFPLGGIGAGMVCLSGTGMITSVSIDNRPLIYHEPNMFAAISVGDKAKVLEGPIPWHKVYGPHGSGLGLSGKNYGLPRFKTAEFESYFPFASVNLTDDIIPFDVSLTGWSPFIPLNPEDSGLPAAALEYTFTNKTDSDIDAVFSYHTARDIFADHIDGEQKLNKSIDNGFVLENVPVTNNEYSLERWFAVTTDESEYYVDNRWLRSGWFDPLTKLWQNIESGELINNPPYPENEDNGMGSSLYIPIHVQANSSYTLKVFLNWYSPKSTLQIGKAVYDCGDNTCCNTCCSTSKYYQPWYSAVFMGIESVTEYFHKNYDLLKKSTKKFTDTFYSTTLPECVVDAISANLSIIKSPTILWQIDGRMWAWEGCADNFGSCHGSCTHVWNYAFAIPNLFPSLERTLRDTEFFISQNKDGHQNFRSNIPISPPEHNFHAASDGQLGGIMKVYREWRISGNDMWIKRIYPKLHESLEYCIKTWDPNKIGVLTQPHHNTYDIEFWGPDGMCTSFYLGALKAMIKILEYLDEDNTEYKAIYESGRNYCETKLFNGEYFYQDIVLDNPALDILKDSKYQYGTGCISDGVIGCWMAKMCGLGDIFDPDKVKSHLKSVYKYNMKHDLSAHSNPQRPGYAIRDEGGLLLCSWPKGNQPMLPFPYSNEVWTGIEYQVASHMAAVGMVDECLDIVTEARKRYDGYKRNPYDEYECGHWYARAMSSYALLSGLTGVRYDNFEKTLYISPNINGDFDSFICTENGYGLVGIKNGEPYIDTVEGNIDVKKIKIS